MENFYSHKVKILSSQRDSLFRLRYDDTLRLFQDIATIHAHQLGIDGPQLMAKDKAFWIVTRTKIRCEELPTENTELEAKTWPLPVEGIRCERCYTLGNASKMYITGITEWVIIDAETRRPRRVDSTHYPTTIDYITEKPIEEPFSKMTNDFSDEDFVCHRIIRSSDIDITHHTNNTVYCTMLIDTFSVKEIETLKIKEIEFHYQHESLEGDSLSIFRKKINDTEYHFAIKKDDGTVVVLAKIIIEK